MADDRQGSDPALTVASMVQSGQGQTQAIERAAGIYESRGIGNSYLITTDEGSVLVNAGALGDAKRGRQLFAAVSDQPIRYIVLTQSHANQFGGLEVYKTPSNSVVAQRTYLEDRQYFNALNQHYQRGSRRVFSQITGPKKDIVPSQEILPDCLFDDYLSFTLGGRRFELISTPGGETRSAAMVWLPDEEIAIVGNLFGPLFGNYPNLNTLRGDKPRSALAFIDSAKRVRHLKPKQILTGHEDIQDQAKIHKQLTRIIDAMQWVHDKTIAGMNAGVGLRRLMADIQPPDGLLLTEEYGKLSWNIRAIYHEYTGWQEPERGITDLYSVPASSIAGDLKELLGGVQPLIERAQAYLNQLQPLHALHLLDIALAAEKNSTQAKTVRAEALKLLQQQTGNKNLWERKIIEAELRDLDEP
ncbi:alkyl sulfatase dimerization domain-containing protein [Halioxenophilus aromaticivorans]|uniref:Metallo-beta-lactamase domain-containing protein n=1 Tax=Halioxenophilus aromaticivorans TaxID=1306992 RepID=A0AAV3U6Q3_9ALTE